MAMTVGNLRVYLTLDSSGYVKGLAEAERQGNVAQRTLGGIGSAVAGMAKAGAAAFAALGAATTAYALTSSKAYVQASQFEQALELVGKQAGVSNDVIREQIGVMTRAGASTQTAREVVMSFMRAQMDATKASELYTRAEDLAVTTGQMGNEVVRQLTHGIETQNIQVLRNAGVIINGQKALDEYAKSLGKSTAELTAAERQTAFFNAVMRESANVAGVAQQMQERGVFNWAALKAPLQDLAETMGSLVAPLTSEVGRALFFLMREFNAATKEGGALYPVMEAIRGVMAQLAAPLKEAGKWLQDFIKNLDSSQIEGFMGALRDWAPVIGAVVGGMALFGTGVLQNMLGPLGQFLGPLASMNPLLTLVIGAMAGLVAVSPELRGMFGELLSDMKPLIGQLGGALTPLLKALVPIFQSLLKAVAQVLPPMIKWFVGLLDALSPLFQPIGRLVSIVIDNLAPVFKAAYEAMQPLLPYLKQLAQALAPVIDFLAPIVGWVVKLLGLALVEWIKGTVEGIILLIRAITWVIEAAKAFASDIETAVRAVVDIFWWLYNALVGGSIIPDLVNGIVGAINGLISAVTGLFWGLVNTVVGIWETIQSGALAAWSWISNTVTGIVAGLWQAVTGWLSNLGSWISGWLAQLWASFNAGWTLIKDTVANLAGQLWSAVTGWLQNLFNWALDFNIRFHAQLSEWWTLIKDTASSLWETIRNTIVTWVTNMADTVVGLVGALKDRVFQVFEDLKNTVIDAVNWVLGRVRDFIGLLNAGLGKFGIEIKVDIPDIPKHARGGIVTEPMYMVGEQHRPETIIPWNPAYRGRAEYLWKLTGQALGLFSKMRGGMGGPGGAQGEWWRGSFPMTQGPGGGFSHAGLAPSWDYSMPNGTPIYMGLPGVVVPGPGGGYGTSLGVNLDAGGSVILAHLQSVLKTGKVPVGEQIAASDNTGFSTGPHMHIEFRNSQLQPGPGGGENTSIFDMVTRWAEEIVSKFAPQEPAFMGGLIKDLLVSKAAPGIAQWIADNFRSKLRELGVGMKQALGLEGNWSGNGTFQDWARQAIAKAGVGDDWLTGLDIAAKNESNYNPNAINNWDINALRGQSSRGVMQVIPPTFDAYKVAGCDNIFDPVCNIAAAINYIKARYGHVNNLQGVKNVLSGGRWVGYDTGGVLRPGATLALNNTGRPEPVLSGATFDRLLSVLDRLDQALSRPLGQGLNVTNNYQGEGVTSQEVVSDLLIALRTL